MTSIGTCRPSHATLRAQDGFNIHQLTAKYRTLRASVLRLWMDDSAPQPEDLEDVIRFNEAIDQALAESVVFFTQEVDRSRKLLLGMPGHDMHSPLQTIQATAHLPSAMDAGGGVSDAAARLARCGERIRSLLEDLLDFGRTELGLGMRMRVESLAQARDSCPMPPVQRQSMQCRQTARSEAVQRREPRSSANAVPQHAGYVQVLPWQTMPAAPWQS